MTTESESPNVIYITEEHRVEWTYDATKELLKFYDEKCDMLETGIIHTQKKLWELVAKDLMKKNFYYTPAQCENKWKSLKRNYKGKIEKADRSGGQKRLCPFEKEITEILSKRPNESIIRTLKNPDRKSDDFDFYNINLNNPPGFSDEERTMKVEDIPENQEQTESYVLQESGPLVEELIEIRKIIAVNSRVTSKVLQQSNEIQSRMVQYLENCEQRDNHRLELDEARIEQQNEIIKQMKIQNSVLQKILEKIG